MTLSETENQALASAVYALMKKDGYFPFARPLKVGEFAEEVGMSGDWVRAEIKAGRIRRIEASGRVLIPRDELKQFQ